MIVRAARTASPVQPCRTAGWCCACRLAIVPPLRPHTHRRPILRLACWSRPGPRLTVRCHHDAVLVVSGPWPKSFGFAPTNACGAALTQNRANTFRTARSGSRSKFLSICEGRPVNPVKTSGSRGRIRHGCDLVGCCRTIDGMEARQFMCCVLPGYVLFRAKSNPEPGRESDPKKKKW